jgi:hypothetical protein
VVDRREEGICIWWQIDASSRMFQIKDRPDERGILMGESIVLLACPSAGLDIVDTADGITPLGFLSLASRLVNESRRIARMN